MKRILRGLIAYGALLIALPQCGPIDTNGTPDDGGVAAAGPTAPSGPVSAPGPVLAIVSPASGQTCQADKHDLTCPVVVWLSGAVFAAAGRCGGASNSCGHLEVFVDGTACGNPNDASPSDTVQAMFGRCPSVDGMHTLWCELRDDREQTLARSQTIIVLVQRGGDDGEGDGD